MHHTHWRTRDKQNEKKNQKKVPQLHGNATFLHFLENVVFLRAELPTNLTKVLQILIFMNKLLTFISFQQYFQTSLSNVSMNTWQNSKYIPVSCFNIIKFYNNVINDVGLMDQKTAACRIDRKSKYRSYLSILFDLMDVTHTRVILFKWNLVMTYCDDILNLKTIVAKALIGGYTNRNRSSSNTRPS